jgi:hypothetical protein
VDALRTGDDLLAADEDVEAVAQRRVVLARHRVERPHLAWQIASGCRMLMCRDQGSSLSGVGTTSQASTAIDAVWHVCWRRSPGEECY